MPTIGTILGDAFDMVRARFAAVAVWAALYFVLSFGLGLVMRPLMAGGINPGGGPHALPGSLLLGLGLLYPLLLVLLVVIYAAAFRATLFPERAAGFYLRLGGDELRLVGLGLLLGLGSLVLIFALSLVLGLLGAAAIATLGSNTGAIVGAALLMIPLMFALFAAFAFIATRLSLAGPLTMLRGRIVIGEAWRLSRGHFWTLFGAYLLLAILFMIAFSIVGAIVGGGTYMAMMRAGSDPAAMQRIVAEQQAATFGPLGIVGGIVTALLGTLSMALFAGAAASATRRLLPTGADVFA